MTNLQQTKPYLWALIAGMLFGLSTPASKVLLGNIEPVLLAGLLYLGSGIGLLVYWLINEYLLNNNRSEAGIRSGDIRWLLIAIMAGGVAAPIVLLLGLKSTPAATASLLLNFEAVTTSIIAFLVFKESIEKRTWLAILIITIAGILLSVNFVGTWGLSIGALGILCACFFWGIDNNATRNISAKDPIAIVTIKGIVAGMVSLIIAYTLHNSIPSAVNIVFAMLIGFFSYGLSIVFFIHALRTLGAARTSALFSATPFVGTAVSIVVLHEVPTLQFYISLPVMLVGVIFLITESHSHQHTHEHIEHDHRHNHDEHHHHEHKDQVSMDTVHSHVHIHKPLKHSHPHTPDIHHRHEHERYSCGNNKK